MFFAEERIAAVREMIVAKTEKQRRKALEKLLPMQRGDFVGIYENYGIQTCYNQILRSTTT